MRGLSIARLHKQRQTIMNINIGINYVIKRGKKSQVLMTLIATCLLMVGCASVTANSCAGYEYIIASKYDTPETKKQVLEHNLFHESVTQ